MKPTTERYGCSGILMSFIHIFVVPHHYQRKKLIHHVVELMFLVGSQREKLSGLNFFFFFLSVLIPSLKMQ